MTDPIDSADTARDATRRTHLASERTQLAWWRTGMTALAVALAVGRVVPDLNDASVRWPYSVLGAGFAFYAVALIAYGTVRSRAVHDALLRGEFVPDDGRVLGALAVAAIVLCIATAGLIIFS